MIIMTPGSISSENVRDEIGYAIDKGKRFLPVMLETCNVPLRLRRFQYVDFTNKNFDDGVESAKELLRNLISETTIPKMGIPVAVQDKEVQANAERDAEAEQLSKQKAEADRLAKQKTEDERLAEAKAKTERKAKEEADSLAAQKAEAERLAKQKVEEERLVQVAENERKAKEEEERLAKQKARAKSVEPKPVSITQKKQASKGLVIGIIAVIALVVVGIRIGALANRGKPANVLTVENSNTSQVDIGSTMISKKDGMTLVFVPAGQFTMGSDVNSDEKPVHKVTLDAYWIDKTKVTNGKYAKCVSSGICQSPSNTSSETYSSYYGNSKFENFPVIYVNWGQAKAYCEWVGRRLPTEAEWEKAARGTDGRTYPWGENIGCNKANYGDCTSNQTAVGSYESGKSPYGLYDMASNVWEWVADWYSDTYYQTSPLSNPLGPSAGQYRVLRGGSERRGGSGFMRYYDARSADRLRYSPDTASNLTGFRCAQSP